MINIILYIVNGLLVLNMFRLVILSDPDVKVDDKISISMGSSFLCVFTEALSIVNTNEMKLACNLFVLLAIFATNLALVFTDIDIVNGFVIVLLLKLVKKVIRYCKIKRMLSKNEYEVYKHLISLDSKSINDLTNCEINASLNNKFALITFKQTLNDETFQNSLVRLHEYINDDNLVKELTANKTQDAKLIKNDKKKQLHVIIDKLKNDKALIAKHKDRTNITKIKLAYYANRIKKEQSN